MNCHKSGIGNRELEEQIALRSPQLESIRDSQFPIPGRTI